MANEIRKIRNKEGTILATLHIEDGVLKRCEETREEISDTDYIIISAADLQDITSIGDDAFKDCVFLTSVTIPDSVTSIGDDAFIWCTSLTFVKIPNSVTSIGRSAFLGCEDLSSVSIPDSVTSISDSAFMHCTSLTSVTIPDSVTSIGDDAFQHCRSLTSVTIPGKVTSIGKRAFLDCNALAYVWIPSSVTSIDWDAFSQRTQCRVFPQNEQASNHIITQLNDSEVCSIAFLRAFIKSLKLELWKSLIDGVKDRVVSSLVPAINLCEQAYKAGDENLKDFIRIYKLSCARIRNSASVSLSNVPIEIWDRIFSMIDVNFAIKSEELSPEKIKVITEEKEDAHASGDRCASAARPKRSGR